MSVFALVAFAGVPVALFAGRIADSRFKDRALGFSLSSLYLSAGLASVVLFFGPIAAVLVLALVVIVNEWSVNSHLILSQRTLFDLAPSHRGRINSLFMAAFYLGGSLGAAVSVFSYMSWGWIAVCIQLWLMAVAANFCESWLWPRARSVSIPGVKTAE